MNPLHNILLTAFDYTKIPLTVLTEINEPIFTTADHIKAREWTNLSFATQSNQILFSHTPDNLLYSSFIFAYEETNYYLLLGPQYLFNIKDGAQILSSEAKLQVKKSLAFFEKWTTFMYKLVTNRQAFKIKKEYFNPLIADTFLHDHAPSPLPQYVSYNADADFLFTQKQIFQFILNGDTANAINSLDQYIALAHLNFNENHIQKSKYQIVTFIALLSNLLVTEKNVNIATVHSLADLYITGVDNLHTEQEVHSFFKEIIVEFSKQTEQINLYSPHATKAIQYITSHLYHPISAQDVADHLALSLSYTSCLFKQEVGITLKKFIQMKRIGEAKMLIMYSDYTTTQIAENLQFCSASYFAKIFSQEVGLTPRQFHKRNTLQT